MGGYVDVGNVYYLYNGIAPAMWIGINHTHETVSYREEERIEASCDSEGGYYLVEFCAGCGKEHSREWVSIAAKHTFDGDFSCSNCGETAEYYREGN